MEVYRSAFGPLTTLACVDSELETFMENSCCIPLERVHNDREFPMKWHELQNVTGITCFRQSGRDPVECLPVRLPRAHVDLLNFTDGLIANNIRLFGIGSSVRDQVWWNSQDCWRFAWRRNVNGYWFFAEEAGGGQYAYELDANGQVGDRIVHFGPITMTPAWYFPDFETFIKNAIIRNETKDAIYVKAVKQFGTIPANKQISMVPHPCLGGDMETGDVMLIEARTAMIMNADLWWAVSELKDGATASGMGTYHDEMGRTRFRLVVDAAASR